MRAVPIAQHAADLPHATEGNPVGIAGPPDRL
ncbi:hypothetical protein BJY16_003977 [Actinoplanes octamycinicus]|uniref:Uncharacterized protein n=1 Tax=Actinoplanes octamycinicus TaxID=135948 RepID=A0A7W7GYB3_9ACTN|nr:hypothetical protein [Actinoplanes octamycinicus]